MNQTTAMDHIQTLHGSTLLLPEKAVSTSAKHCDSGILLIVWCKQAETWCVVVAEPTVTTKITALTCHKQDS